MSKRLEGSALVEYLLNNPRRLEIAVLGQLGFSNKLIRRTSHCSNWYIQNVLHRANIKRKDYRDGLNRTSNTVIGSMRQIAQREIQSSLRRQLKG